jgi:hypothetical protein
MGNRGSMESEINASDSEGLSEFAQGTPWLPEDQVAVIHQGEMIVPADNNPFNSPISSFNADNSDVVEIVKWMAGVLSTKLDALIAGTGRANMRARIQENSDIGYVYSR